MEEFFASTLFLYHVAVIHATSGSDTVSLQVAVITASLQVAVIIASLQVAVIIVSLQHCTYHCNIALVTATLD